MFPMMPAQGNKEERQLIKLYQSLAEADRNTVFAFAEFLHSKYSDPSEPSNETEELVSKTPLNIPRPEEESVIKAIKRLTNNYPMVDKESILHPISGLMTSHIMQGRDTVEVIDDLEVLFLKEFKSLAEK
ncbi:MAG TPA: Crp/Fnr family transcriptional regulator [Leucothrix sp.]|nr:Crp/Fnr family transcriptional regulator [Leucothrix sp.]